MKHSQNWIVFFFSLLIVGSHLLSSCRRGGVEGNVYAGDTIGYYHSKIVYTQNHNFYISDAFGKQVIQNSFDVHVKKDISISEYKTRLAFIDIDSSVYINLLSDDTYQHYLDKGKFTAVEWGENDVLYGLQNNEIIPINSALALPHYEIESHYIIQHFAIGDSNSLAVCLFDITTNDRLICLYKNGSLQPVKEWNIGSDSVYNIDVNWENNFIAFGLSDSIKIWNLKTDEVQTQTLNYGVFSLSRKGNDLAYTNYNNNTLSVIDLRFQRNNRTIQTEFDVHLIDGMDSK